MNLEETQGHRQETAPGDGSRRRFAAGVVTQVQARVVARLLGADEPDAIALHRRLSSPVEGQASMARGDPPAGTLTGRGLPVQLEPGPSTSALASP
jgi:hypothetical protein